MCTIPRTRPFKELTIKVDSVKISQLEVKKITPQSCSTIVVQSLLVFTDLGVCPEKNEVKLQIDRFRKDPHPAARLHLVAVQPPVLQLLLKT